MAKVYIDPGHGGSDPGAVANGLKEKDLTLKIAKYARTYLEDKYKNVSVRMSRTGDTYPSLSARASDANRWGADVFVSIHINAGGGVGYEDYIYNGNVSSNTKKLQDTIHKEVAPLFTKDRGKKRANFAVLRKTKMPAILPECGFIDNKTDAAFLKKNSNLKKLGEAIAKGIAKYLGLEKGSSKPKKSSKKKSSGSNSKSISKMADEVIAGKHGIGHETRRKSLGISKSEYEKVRDEVNRRLSGGSKKKKKKKASKPKANLTVDGKWGPATTKALQKALGLKYRDGILSSQPKNSVTRALYGGVTWGSKGSPTVKSLQRKVGAGQDGKLGPATVRSMQRYLDTPVDGVISRPSSMVVKEMQRRLNKGTF